MCIQCVYSIQYTTFYSGTSTLLLRKQVSNDQSYCVETATSCFLQANVVVASSTRKYNIIAKKIVLYRLGFGIGLNVGHWLGIVF